MNRVKEELKNPPKNVASHLWEKFKALEKRTNDVTQRSTEKRIKHLQKQVLETVNTEFTTDEDKDILREYDVKFGPTVEGPPENKQKRKRTKAGNAAEGSSSEPSSGQSSGPVEKLRAFMDINEHLVTHDLSRPPPPTVLEQNMNSAIKRGDLDTAEILSNHLSEREAGERIVAAIESKKYLEEKEVEKEMMKARNKKKLHWRFDPKERWETKGNM